MDLFENNKDAGTNWLPYDGVVLYLGRIMDIEKANSYYKQLYNKIAWRRDENIIFGKKITTKRKVAWYGDKTFEYTYSGITKSALKWIPELFEVKSMVEDVSGDTFNSCLLNLYHNGNEGMSWHSDGEKVLKKNGAIASLSFGISRKFLFKHKKSGEKIELFLENGSLLLMKDTTQKHWLHRLPTSKKINRPRINLTFRTMVENVKNGV